MGQCVQGKLPGGFPAGFTGHFKVGGRRLRGLTEEESSDGVRFPSGDAVKVSKEMAEKACADLGEQRDNCITDLRMVNEPDAVTKIKEDFETVEKTVGKLETIATTTMIVDSSPITHLCFSVLALATLIAV